MHDLLAFPDAWSFVPCSSWLFVRVDVSAGGCEGEAIISPIVGIFMVISINVGIKLIGLKGESD